MGNLSEDAEILRTAKLQQSQPTASSRPAVVAKSDAVPFHNLTSPTGVVIKMMEDEVEFNKDAKVIAE